MTTEITIKTDAGELVCPSEKGTGYLDTFIGVLEQYPDAKAAIERTLGKALAEYLDQNLMATGLLLEEEVGNDDEDPGNAPGPDRGKDE
jgi:hypothetical protein